jgi:[protein-PII] uridylyltransferase
MTAPGNLTAWKEQLLDELFQRGRRFLRGEAEAESKALAEQLRKTRERVRDLLLEPRPAPAATGTEELPAPPAPAPRAIDTVDSDLAGIDERLFASLSARQMARPAEIAVAYYPLKGHSELAVVTADRHGLLAAIAAALAASRIDVLGAVIGAGRLAAPGTSGSPGAPPDASSRASSRAAGDVLAMDVFFVRDLAGRAIPEHDARWTRFRDALRALLTGDLDHEAEKRLLARRQQSSLAPRVTPGVTTRIKIDNDASAEATVVEVFTQDRAGVLHAITRTLTDFGLDIHVSKVATEGEQVADIFYVTIGSPRRKLLDPEPLKHLQERLHAALDAV